MNTPNPGQAPLCAGCLFVNEELRRQGHPNACRLVRWEGQKHVEPTLSETGCSGFAVKSTPKGSAPSNETASLAPRPGV